MERQRLRLEIAFGHVGRQEIVVLVLAANQRRPVPRPDRLSQMRRDIANGKPNAAVIRAVRLRAVKQQHMMKRGLARLQFDMDGLGFVGELGVVETTRTPAYPLFLVPFLAMSRSVVLLPEPLGPKSVKNSPSLITRLRSSTAVTGPYRF